MFADSEVFPTSIIGIISAIVILVLVPFLSAVSFLILKKLQKMWHLNGNSPPELREQMGSKQPVELLAEIHEATVPKE